MPERIQQSRQHPWRAGHPDAIVVSRGKGRRWGNPFAVGMPLLDGAAKVVDRQHAVDLYTNWLTNSVDAEGRYVHGSTSYHGAESADRPSIDEIREQLAGHDLVCWCPLDQPCHADVLLNIANGPTPHNLGSVPTHVPTDDVD